VPADITMAGEALMNSETPISPFEQTPEQRSLIGRLIRFCLTNKLVVGLFVLAMVVAGLTVAPFDWQLGGMTRYPIATDAIPDIGENQQIVFTAWPGRSPQDVEDQITYPLTVSLLGVPGVKTIRSYSFFGFSSVYVIFKEGVEFYWSRTRVLEKLNSLPAGTLPADVRPALGPDATALGQVYWYTLEGRDEQGKPAGGWDLDELRTIQDWYARYWLLSADGAAEVASIGGYVREYQVDVDPDAMRAYGVTLGDVAQAVRASNLDVGAKTLELNRVEYFVRGVGFIKSVADIESSVVKVRDNVPILIKQVATVTLGPAMRRGALDKGGAQAVGGVVVARYGDNPLRVIKNIKAKIAETAEALPAKAVVDFSKVTKQQVSQYAKAHGFEAYAGTRLDSKAFLAHLRKIPPKDRPDWITISRVTVVPFYDRTGLIYETLGTLNDAISLEILITVIVIIVMVVHLRSSFIIAITLPLAVLLCFIGMKAFGVDANILALSGIVIAIGTIVDMGIVVCENTLRHLDQAFALLASIIIALTVVPPACHILFCGKISGRRLRHGLFGFIGIVGLGLMGWGFAQGAFLLVASGLAVICFAANSLFKDRIPQRLERLAPMIASAIIVLLVGMLLSRFWEPLGPRRGVIRNFIFVGVMIVALLGFFHLIRLLYEPMLHWCLRHKLLFLSVPTLVVLLGITAWLGFDKVFGFIPAAGQALGVSQSKTRSTVFWAGATKKFPGFGKEFMPPLDEGSYLFMPTTMVHASIGEALDILARQDAALQAIPEVDSVVGKIGRAETPLDPAPISMIETVINYKPQYITDKAGRRVNFRYDPGGTRIFSDERGQALLAPDGKSYRVSGRFPRDKEGRLIPDKSGRPFRLWRPALEQVINPGRQAWGGIRKSDDIWSEIIRGHRKSRPANRAIPETGSRHRACNRYRRPHRRQAISGNRSRSPGPGPLRRSHWRVSGGSGGRHRRAENNHDGGRQRAVPRPRAIPARAAGRLRQARKNTRALRRRRGRADIATGPHSLHPRPAGYQKRGYLPGGLCRVRQNHRSRRSGCSRVRPAIFTVQDTLRRTGPPSRSELQLRRQLREPATGTKNARSDSADSPVRDIPDYLLPVQIHHHDDDSFLRYFRRLGWRVFAAVRRGVGWVPRAVRDSFGQRRDPVDISRPGIPRQAARLGRGDSPSHRHRR